MAFLPGTEGGGAIADTLFGKASPSGRLPVSWPKDSSSFPLAYNEAGKPYDPRFPFGYGLSYTRFKLHDLRAPWHASPGQRISASVDVANVGRSAGTDTVLAFLVSGDGSRRLVAFDRVEPGRHHGGTAHLTFSAPAGSYKLVVGDLSRPLRVG
jgi:beta-glucosidase